VQQLVWPDLDLDLMEVELPDSVDALNRYLAAEREGSFDLATELVRTRLLRIGAERVLVLTLHHAITDGWSSWTVLARELPALYRQRAFGEPAGLAPLEVQLGDFAAWERGVGGETERAYWRERLARRTVPLSIYHPQPVPFDRAQGVWHSTGVRLAEPTTMRALTEQATALRLSVPLALTAVAAHTLAPHANGDLTIGYITSNRDRPELRSVVGFVADFVPLRIDVSDAPCFTDLAARIRRAADEADAHRIPFGAIHEAVRGRGLWSINPLCDLLVNYRPYALGDHWTPRRSEPVSTLAVPDEPPMRIHDARLMLPAHMELALIPQPDGALRGTVSGARARVSPDRAIEFGRAFADELEALVRKMSR